MNRKQSQQAVIVFALLITLVLVWFLYRQGEEFSDFPQTGQGVDRSAPSREVKDNNDEEIGSGIADREAAGNETMAELQEKEEEIGQSVPDDDPPGQTRERIPVTREFFRDFTSFVASRYHPGESLEHPGENPELRLRFKELNARYGMDFTGLRHSESEQEEARQEILDSLLSSELLQDAYERYADLFLQELRSSAEEQERRFPVGNGEVRARELNIQEISVMFRLCGSYLRDLSGLFRTLAEKPELISRVERYLQAEEQAVRKNYKWNQIKTRLDSLEEGDPGSVSPETGRTLDSLRQRELEVSSAYRQALEEREEHRQAIVSGVHRYLERDLSLDSVEVLYISQWVHRRLQQENNREAILLGADLLGDLADRLVQESRQMRPQ